MNKTVNEGFKVVLTALLLVFLPAVTTQAAAPFSAPESRFVWEPGSNLSFTWTPANFDRFYCDLQSRTGKGFEYSQSPII